MLRRFLGALVLCLLMTGSLAAQAGFSWKNCAPTAPIAVTTMQVMPDWPPTPAPLALTASVDSTLGKVTDLHGYVMFGPIPFFLESGPLALDVSNRFVSLPGAIPTTAPFVPGGFPGMGSVCKILAPYSLPCEEPISSGKYRTSAAGIPFIFGDGASVDTLVTAVHTKVDITTTNLTGGSVALSFNGVSGFPLPPTAPISPLRPPGPRNYAAQVELLDPEEDTLGCLGLTLGANFVACTVNVAAQPQPLAATGEMTPVAIDMTASFGCVTGACGIVSVSSNDPSARNAVTSGDAVITGLLNVSLKAESGRVYTVTLKCLDSFGIASNKSVTVVVQ